MEIDINQGKEDPRTKVKQKTEKAGRRKHNQVKISQVLYQDVRYKEDLQAAGFLTNISSLKQNKTNDSKMLCCLGGCTNWW